MSQHDFDKELQDLYQKRKQQITAPDVEFPLVRKKRFFIGKPSLLILGGLSAFGLMAVVNHYTQPSPQKIIPSQAVKYVLDVTQYEEVKEESIIIPSQQPLPSKPISKLPQSPKLEVLPSNNIVVNTDIDLPKGATKNIELPTMKPSALPVYPTLKVMPEYDVYDLNDVESASIELRYQVNVSGAIHNIEIVKSSVNRKLQKSAVKALSQWRYEPVNEVKNNEKYFRVVFDFTAKSKTDDVL